MAWMRTSGDKVVTLTPSGGVSKAIGRKNQKPEVPPFDASEISGRDVVTSSGGSPEGAQANTTKRTEALRARIMGTGRVAAGRSPVISKKERARFGPTET